MMTAAEWASGMQRLGELLRENSVSMKELTEAAKATEAAREFDARGDQ